MFECTDLVGGSGGGSGAAASAGTKEYLSLLQQASINMDLVCYWADQKHAWNMPDLLEHSLSTVSTCRAAAHRTQVARYLAGVRTVGHDTTLPWCSFKLFGAQGAVLDTLHHLGARPAGGTRGRRVAATPLRRRRRRRQVRRALRAVLDALHVQRAGHARLAHRLLVAAAVRHCWCGRLTPASLRCEAS